MKPPPRGIVDIALIRLDAAAADDLAIPLFKLRMRKIRRNILHVFQTKK